MPSDHSLALVLVTGDLVVDHHIYEGDRLTPTASHKRGVAEVATVGGANGLYELVRNIAEQPAAEIAHALGVTTPDLRTDDPPHHAYALWQPYQRDRRGKPDDRVWRTKARLGYAEPKAGATWEAKATKIDGNPGVIVLDDAGYGFRNKANSECWHLPAPGAAPWLLLKIADPHCEGDLWRQLVPESGPGYADRLVCLLSAQDLRREAAMIRSEASWERTLEDVDVALHRKALAPLLRCRHLIIAFGSDGVLWLQPTQPREPARLCLSSAGAEGDYSAGIDGTVVGYLTAMAGAIAFGLSKSAPGEAPALASPIEAGLRSLRLLQRIGHGKAVEQPGSQPPGYPYLELAKEIMRAAPSREDRKWDKRLSTVEFSWPPPEDPGNAMGWTLVQASEHPPGSAAPPSLVGLATLILRHGDVEYDGLPHARFGKFVTLERREIEMLRQIRRQMIAYKRGAGPGEKPLCFGVFGPPGAGKSFAVREIAGELFDKESWLEFNLSQFNGPADLIGALHQVRDKVLEGFIPVVFWDEFDSQELQWLKYLLAPMQDGRFQEGQVSHAVGRSIFVFAGGTAKRWSDFGKPTGDSLSEGELKQLKVPDFRSRLDACYDVSGPNPRPPGPGEALDIGYTIRRALLIRGQLRIGGDEPLDVEADLARALLTVPNYNHGARSLEKLVKPLYRNRGDSLRRSDLPPPGQLAMHVLAAKFESLLTAHEAFIMSPAIDLIAAEIHSAYREREQAARRAVSAEFDKDFAGLSEAGKHDNREAARRIPAILALVGLGVEPKGHAPSSPGPKRCELVAHIDRHLERMAKAEHDGWRDVRRRNGWTYGENRDPDSRRHPCMVPYADLPGVDKYAQDRDRASVRAYPERLKHVDYRIVWLPGPPILGDTETEESVVPVMDVSPTSKPSPR